LYSFAMPDRDPQPVPTSIETLCRQASAGDESALERLLKLHHGRLIGFIERKTGSEWQGKIEADDVLQDVYIAVHEGIRNFAYKNEDSFYRWATFLAERAFINRVRLLRRRKRDVSREVTAGGASVSRHQSFLQRVAVDSATPSRVAHQAEAVSALMSAIARLPPDYRTVIQRVYLNEEAISTVAADMQRSEDAVRRMGSRALERLRAAL